MGNDPIQEFDFSPYQATKPFVLVGTSIFGAIALAGHLGEKLSTPPQVVIVDLSHQVARSWDLIKAYFKTSTETQPEQFVNGFCKMLQKNKSNEFSMDGDSQDLHPFLLGLIDQCGFLRFKQLVTDALILKQSWGDEATFRHIRNVYQDMDIVAYPSNIIHSIGDLKTQKEVAHCVHILQPVFSIQTNLEQGEPSQLHVMTDHSIKAIMKTLGPGPFLEADDKLAFEKEFLTVSPNSTGVKWTSESAPGLLFYQPAHNTGDSKVETDCGATTITSAYEV